ncbi:MAG: penicillin acylase family protein [Gemmatimonadetes bacterium]|nr:penicillin acylase family protein [Gemmatimonadota bacterium]
MRRATLGLSFGLSLGLAFGRLVAQTPDAVEVRYTAYGMPHVRATTLAGAGEGYGWAFARENLCLMLEKTVTLAGERSRSIGPDSSYVDDFVGVRLTNVESDAVHRYLLDPAAVDAARRAASADVHALVRGYVAGFNRHVRAAALPGEACRAQPWFRPLTEEDIWRRITQVPLIMTSMLLIKEIGVAAPPGRSDAGADAATESARPDALRALAALGGPTGGSNALAAGRAVLGASGGGFTFSNPHFPWRGSERLYAMHLTVPGRLDLFGSTLYGVPVPMIGFSESIGWSDTHTTDKRSTIYELTLDPADPTRYRVGDSTLAMRAVVVEIPTAGGRRTHTIWETRYGPVIVTPALPWTRDRAYAFADPERGNVRMADTFLAIASARSVHDIRDALVRHQGSPWSNITAADRHGEVLFANISVAGYVTDAQLARCRVTSAARAYENLADVTVLNGSDPQCAWTRDPRAPQPGIIPAELRPWTIRQDVTLNSNDSHWFPSPMPGATLEGYLQVIGPERTARGERTRIASLYARAHLGAAAERLTPASWEARFFASRNLLAELVLDDLLADCRATPRVTLVDGWAADLTEPCRVLAAWDRTDRLSSRGSALFAEFARGFERIPMTGFAWAPRFWRVPFDPADPVGTPRGFVASDETRRILARAALRFTGASLALDAPLEALQSTTRGGQRLALSGASYTYHMVSPAAFEPAKGITEIYHGDSYIHAVTLGAGGPTGRFIVTYSQSTNPASPHFADMTAVYARQEWIDVAFTPEAIAAAQVGPPVRWVR